MQGSIVRAIALLAAWLALAFGAAASGAAEPNTLSEHEIAAGWILLFDGHSTYGWEPNSKADWKVAEGTLAASSGEPGLLLTTSEFADFNLKVDFRVPPETNSGVFLRTGSKPTDPAKDCYEVNIAAEGVSPFPTASLVGRQKATAAATPGEWHTLEMQASGATLRIQLDGQTVTEYEDNQPLRRGRIGLQLNTGPVEFCNIKLQPLALQEIFNGQDLAGWRVFPDRQSEFTATPQRELSVKNGPGALESERSYGDFVLQLEAYVGGPSLNSGVFFRSIPGEFCNGYESQIHNGYKDGDRKQPVDGGTGAIYRRQAAREVVADDFKWLSKTLVASGPHMAVWVNGYQVNDWTDTRPAHENPRKGLRTEPGTLFIQGHDPTTNLLFRNLRIAELPAANTE